MHAIHLLLAYPTFRNALITAVAVGTVCSLLSVIVVLKRFAFIGQGISHAGFGGIGTAILLGITPGLGQDLIVLIFCLTTAVLIGSLSRRRTVEVDSAIGILLVAAMAWGVLATDLAATLEQYPWYLRLVGGAHARPGFESLLFGSLLSVGPTDTVVAVILATAVLVTFLLLLKQITFYTFDETVAQVFGIPAALIHYLLLILLALTIVLSIRLIGFILVSALLVLPGATANLLTRRWSTVFVASLVTGLAGVLGGLWLSLETGNLSSGPCVVLALCGLFMLALVGRRVRAPRRRA